MDEGYNSLFVAVLCNQTSFCCIFQSRCHVCSSVGLPDCIHIKLSNTKSLCSAHELLTHGSPKLLCFKHSSVIEISSGMRFNFYPKLCVCVCYTKYFHFADFALL